MVLLFRYTFYYWIDSKYHTIVVDHKFQVLGAAHTFPETLVLILVKRIALQKFLYSL